MEFKQLRLSSRQFIEQFLASGEHYLSAYHFCNIFIWSRLFKISYIILDGYLCIFFKDEHSCFMYLPPLPPKIGRATIRRCVEEGPDARLIKRCYAIMDRFNTNKQISRIENVEEKQLKFYQGLGYDYSAKPPDYLCRRQDIAGLAGNRFKSKRASHNYFVKHHEFKFSPFLKQDKDACLSLYQSWVRQRRHKFSDSLYRGMLEEGFSCHKLAMENFFQLGLVGYVVRVKDKISGYTFGFQLNPRIFCILFEICDLGCRGISQFIFSQFCRQLSGYKYVNIMDDSGLPNLRRVKLSYRPVRIIPNYIIKR